MSKKYVKIMFWISLVLVVLLICSSGTKYKTSGEDYYNVTSGDTLWGIASEYKPAQMDTREYIHILKEMNEGLGNVIVPGQAIVLPIMVKV